MAKKTIFFTILIFFAALSFMTKYNNVYAGTTKINLQTPSTGNKSFTFKVFVKGALRATLQSNKHVTIPSIATGDKVEVKIYNSNNSLIQTLIFDNSLIAYYDNYEIEYENGSFDLRALTD